MAYYKTYIELCDYFAAMPTSVTELKSVVVGSDEEEISLQNSRIVYPCLRVDTPTIRYIDEDNTPRTRYRFTLFLGTNEPKKTNADENAALSAMEALLRKVYKRLWTDADAGLFDLVLGDAGGDAIRHWSADNLFGWMLTIDIDLYPDECA